VRLGATVVGRVQGVGFRYHVRREAIRLGLRGWVANRPDGGVECLVEGDRSDVEELLRSLHEGPPGAEVDRVDVAWLPAGGDLDGFSVRAWGHGGD
jgi:acylphosphatase